MNPFSKLFQRLQEDSKAINKLATEFRAYNLLVTTEEMFRGVLREYNSESAFASAYGIPKLIYTKNNGLVKIYLPKESFSTDVRQLMKDLDATIDEYYGVVQFDGTEPEARGEYVFDDPVYINPINKYLPTAVPDIQTDDSKDKNDNRSKPDKKKRVLVKIRKKDKEEPEKTDSTEDDTFSDEDTTDSKTSDNTEDTDKVDISDDEFDQEDNSESDEDSDSNSDIDGDALFGTDSEDDSESEDQNTEDNFEDNEEEKEETPSEGTPEKRNRAYYMRAVDDTEDDLEAKEDQESDEIPDGEEPESVDDFFSDKETEASLAKKSDAIEKDLSKELDDRIKREKDLKKKSGKLRKVKKKIKERLSLTSKKRNSNRGFKKRRKKVPVREVTSIGAIPSSKIGSVDIMTSMATDIIPVNDFNEFDRVRKSSILPREAIRRKKRRVLKEQFYSV